MLITVLCLFFPQLLLYTMDVNLVMKLADNNSSDNDSGDKEESYKEPKGKGKATAESDEEEPVYKEPKGKGKATEREEYGAFVEDRDVKFPPKPEGYKSYQENSDTPHVPRPTQYKSLEDRIHEEIKEYNEQLKHLNPCSEEYLDIMDLRDSALDSLTLMKDVPNVYKSKHIPESSDHKRGGDSSDEPGPSKRRD
jgi:hypothetical protein